MITIISCDYLNLSLANEYVDEVIISTQVIKCNQNVLQADQPIRLEYSNQNKLLLSNWISIINIYNNHVSAETRATWQMIPPGQIDHQQRYRPRDNNEKVEDPAWLTFVRINYCMLWAITLTIYLTEKNKSHIYYVVQI